MLYWGMQVQPDNINLAKLIEDRLPPDIVAFIRKAGTIAAGRGEPLYLVGGAVRDLLLGRGTLDIDLVAEGNAIALADLLAADIGGKVTVHRRFGTATLKWDNKSIDFVTARSEVYQKPGALPQVKPGSITDDLARRDFTINAMAAAVDPERYGELIDLHNGIRDLNEKAVRVLHEKSFSDDATRMWRAVRYEQRLGFAIGPMTLLLLERDLPMLATVSGDRIRHEIELVLKEAEPENALRRAAHLGLLERINPALSFNEDLAARFDTARRRYGDSLPSDLYLALLLCQLPATALEETVGYLHLTGTEQTTITQAAAVQDRVEELATPGLSPSRVYDILHGYQPAALMAASVCADAAVAEQVELYLNVLRHVKPALSGEDLKQMGIAEGRAIKKILVSLREARLDGTVNSKADEEALVNGLLEMK